MEDTRAFEQAVQDHLSRLCLEFGFRSETEHIGAVTKIVFRTDKVTLKLIHVPHYSDIEVCLTDNTSKKEYGIEVIMGRDPLSFKAWRTRLAETPVEVERFVKDLAEEIFKNEQMLLRGESAAFRTLAQRHEALLRQYGM